ncbi:MAG: hypothetical protein EKK55_12490 [Rhodocyclaceae bacterium]|nr:MAG: hypothetical protein EKK55_12490 [Rhodocyclaceae bacterium]
MDPFAVEGPAIINVSGGRTSMAMLRWILDAHGGRLPDDVVAAFADTGRELPETLDFVAECERRWQVKIERISRPGLFAGLLNDVQAASALRGQRARLPAPRARYCTVRLKREPAERLAVERFGDANGVVDALTWVVGLRADEPSRLSRMRARGGERRPVYAAGDEPWTRLESDRPKRIGYVDYDYAFPLAEAWIQEADIREFWDSQPFDLGIPSSSGNCTHCSAELLREAERLRREAPGYCKGLAERLDRPGRARGLQLPVLEPDLGGCTLCTD